MLQITLTFDPCSVDPEKLTQIANALRQFMKPAANELQILASEQAADLSQHPFALPVEADDPVLFFGKASADPLPLGASPAPSIVAAPVPPTALAVDFSTQPNNVTETNAQKPASTVGAAVMENVTVETPAPAVELDKNNLPWDRRIHAESKTKVADGSWRKRKNSSPETLAQVESELRALMAIPTPAPAVAAPVPPAPAVAAPVPPAPAVAAPVPPAPAVAAPVPPAPAVAAPVPPAPAVAAPVPPAPAVAAPVPPAPAVAAPVPPAPAVDLSVYAASIEGYTALIKTVSKGVIDRRISLGDVNAACSRHGLPALALLVSRTDLVPTIAAELIPILSSVPHE